MSWTSNGKAVASRGPSPLILVDRTCDPQLALVDATISALQASRLDASRGNFRVSRSGQAAINAMYDLTEVDELYEVARGISFEIGEVESL
ncbi:MAG TPA: hypothetical protein VE053_06900 [Allosphingosinicella sp.]|nr:hypothetical protein [Allosphingosinicella sp.]